MKNFFISIFCLTATSVATNAQLTAPGVLTAQNSKSYASIVTEANASRSNAMAYDTDNSLFTAGVFDTAFEGLEPIAASSYIMKNGANLTPSWKVALAGAATVTCLLPDGQGGVYAAGTLADEVEFGSTDGVAITKEGYKEGDAFTTSQCASFVAHYDNAGKLLKVSTILPKHDPALDATMSFFPADGDLYCNINSLMLNGDKLYAGFNLCGVVDSANGSLTSGAMDMEGWGFYFQAMRAAGVAELNADLGFESFVASATSKAHTELTSAEQVYSSNATIANGHLYFGVICTGTTNLNLAGETTPYDITKSNTGIIFGYIVSDINLADKSSKVKTFIAETEDTFAATTFGNMTVAGDILVISGNFQGENGFDNAIKAAGSSDIYTAALNTSDLSTSFVKATGYDEADKTKYEELFTKSAVCGNLLFLNGYTSQKADHTLTAPLSYIYDMTSGNLTKLDVATYTFGMAANEASKLLANAYSPAAITGITFADYQVTCAGVEDVKLNTIDMTVYPNPATDRLNFSEECDVEIFSVNGAAAAKAAGVTSIDVTALPAGIYFAKAANANGSATVKFIKK